MGAEGDPVRTTQGSDDAVWEGRQPKPLVAPERWAAKAYGAMVAPLKRPNEGRNAE